METNVTQVSSAGAMMGHGPHSIVFSEPVAASNGKVSKALSITAGLTIIHGQTGNSSTNVVCKSVSGAKMLLYFFIYFYMAGGRHGRASRRMGSPDP
jgi:hypothetical protein